jgi:heme-degrading monooxygenase HmoA
MSPIAQTPAPPYYAVIFTSTRQPGDNGYAETARKMVALASQQQGFLGIETTRDGVGITVSYWADLESIRQWAKHAEHQAAKEKGKNIWYEHFRTRIARVEKEY